MLRNSKIIEHYVNSLSKLANDLAPEEETSDSFLSRLFKKTAEEKKLSNYILESLQKFQFRQTFPSLSFREENELLKMLANVSKHSIRVAVLKLAHEDELDREFMKTFSMIHACIKSFMYHLFPLKKKEELNLHYLAHYADCREIGMSFPPRHELLKREVLDVLYRYHHPQSIAKLNKIITAAIESLENDHLGINSHSANHSQRFKTLLKWLNEFRLMLIDQSDTILLAPITRALDRALGIVRPDAHRTLQVQSAMLSKFDLIQNEINSLDTRKSIIDRHCRDGVVKIGIFSRAKSTVVTPQKTPDSPVLGITRLI